MTARTSTSRRRPAGVAGRRLVGIEFGHGASRLPPRWLVGSGAQVQVDPAALKLQLIDLTLAVVLAVMLVWCLVWVLAGWRRQGE
jgi:hypothetical protein